MEIDNTNKKSKLTLDTAKIQGIHKIEWENGERIGNSGGFGVAYKVYKIVDGKKETTPYAKKELKNTDTLSIERFKKEVRILKQLNHPRIIKVVSENLNSIPYYYIMPLYKYSMEENLQTIKGDFTKLKKIFNNIFDGVYYLHEQGVFHRDLKPANILMNSDNDLVISDFGLCLNIFSDSIRLAFTGEAFGTQFYSSPEQSEDFKHVDKRTDIYSLGKIIYVCFASGNSFASLETSTILPSINYVINKATKKNREERFSNIEELRDSFNSAISAISDTEETNNIDLLLGNLESLFMEDIHLNSKDIEKIIMYLQKNIDNPDEVNEVIMKLPSHIFAQMLISYKEIVEKIIEIFKNHVTEQEWPFNYTDTIADKCLSFYNSISDMQIKAKLIYILVEMGVSHNRFYVINIAKDLLQKIKKPSEGFIVVEELKPIRRKFILLEIDKSKLIKVFSKLY